MGYFDFVHPVQNTRFKVFDRYSVESMFCIIIHDTRRKIHFERNQQKLKLDAIRISKYYHQKIFNAEKSISIEILTD